MKIRKTYISPFTRFTATRLGRLANTCKHWSYYKLLVTFAYYIKSFAIAILLFFPSFLAPFLTDCQNFFKECFVILYPESMWRTLDPFIVHTKKCFHKNYCSGCYSQRVCTWHDLFTVTSVYSIRKSTRNSQKLRSKLVRWQKIQCLTVKAERNLRKKKRRDAQKKKFIDDPCESNIKNVVEKHV